MAWTPPPRIGRYALKAVLRETDILVHYLAEEDVLGRLVAVTFTAHPIPAPEIWEAMRANVARLAKVRHPNVVAVHHLDFVDGRPFLITGLVPGGTIPESRPLPRPWPEVLAVGRALAAGLAALHRVGIVHRNVNLPSIRLAADGRPVLMDLATPGGWKDVAATRGRYVALGHEENLGHTIAPEVRDGAAPSPASDVYALGTVLHELLGVPAPQDGGASPALAQLTPDPLLSALGDVLARDPEARPKDGAALRERLDAVRVALSARRRAALADDREVQDLLAALERVEPQADALRQALSRSAPAFAPAAERHSSGLRAARLAVAELEHPDLLADTRSERLAVLRTHGIDRGALRRGTDALQAALLAHDPLGDGLEDAWEAAFDALDRALGPGLEAG